MSPETLRGALAVLFCESPKDSVIVLKVARHADDMRAWAPSTVAWLRIPTSNERAIALARLKGKPDGKEISLDPEALLRVFSGLGGLEIIPAGFICAMLAEIEANAHKGEWEKWEPSIEGAFSELLHHFEKLRRAVNAAHFDRAAIREYCADVANIASKLWVASWPISERASHE